MARARIRARGCLATGRKASVSTSWFGPSARSVGLRRRIAVLASAGIVVAIGLFGPISTASAAAGHQHRQVRQRPGRRQPDRAARGRRQHGDLHLRGDQHRQRAPGQRRRQRRQAGTDHQLHRRHQRQRPARPDRDLDLHRRPPPPWPASRPTSAPSPARTPAPAPPSPTTTRPTTSATPRRSTSSSSSTARTPTPRPGRTWPPAAR